MTESTARRFEDLAAQVRGGRFSNLEVAEALEAAAFNTRANLQQIKPRQVAAMSTPEAQVSALIPKMSFAARARIREALA